MTKDEALKLALEYVELVPDDRYNAEHIDREALVTAIKEALAQPEQDWSMIEAMQGSLREHMARIKELESQLARPEQEPFAFLHPQKGFYFAKPTKITAPTIVDVEPLPLYTTPPQRKPLTDEEVNKLVDDEDWYNDPHGFVRVIEAAHGIKGVA